MTETSIVDFRQCFYIAAIKKFSFQLPHAHILRTQNCGNTHWKSVNVCSAYHYVLWHQDYAEHSEASFSHQIQYEYYGGNIYVSTEGIALEHFSAAYQGTSSSCLQGCKFHAVFQSFLSDNSKKYASIKAIHSKRIIYLLENRQKWSNYHMGKNMC